MSSPEMASFSILLWKSAVVLSARKSMTLSLYSVPVASKAFFMAALILLMLKSTRSPSLFLTLYSFCPPVCIIVCIRHIPRTCTDGTSGLTTSASACISASVKPSSPCPAMRSPESLNSCM